MARITEGAPRARVLTQALALALAGCSCQPKSDPPKPPSRTEDSGSQVDTPTDTDTSPPDPPEPYTGPYPLTPADRTWVAGEPYDEAGRTLDVGDADGDGLAEVLIGTPSGFVYGPDADLSHSGAYLVDVDAPTGTIDLVAFATFHGDPDHNGDYFGHSLGVVGDLTSDGRPDVMIFGDLIDGMPLFAGPAAGLVLAADHWSAITTDPGTENRPSGVVPCGDVTGDGALDLCFRTGISVLGHPRKSKVYVLSSVSPGLQPIEDAAVELVADAAEGIGVSLAGGADLTGDGVNDLVIGADERDERRGGAYLSWDNTRGVHDVSVEGALWSGVEVDEQAGLGLAIGDGPAPERHGSGRRRARRRVRRGPPVGRAPGARLRGHDEGRALARRRLPPAPGRVAVRLVRCRGGDR